LAKKVGLGLFEKHLKQYETADPEYEVYTDKKGRQRKRRRDLPPGLSKRDQKILRKVQFRAHHLDKGFNLCGMRFGWTFVVGLIPGAGDVADFALNYALVVRKAKQAEIPDWLITKMHTNNVASVVMGLVPLAGDVAIATFKANSRNAALLEEFLRIRGQEFLKSDSARREDPSNVKPGAGREEGEVVTVTKKRSIFG